MSTEKQQNEEQDAIATESLQQTRQYAKVDAMGYRLDEMKGIMLQRQLRMVQMAELNNQINTLRVSARGEKLEREISARDMKAVPSSTAGPS